MNDETHRTLGRDTTRSHEGQELEFWTKTAACWLTLPPLPLFLSCGYQLCFSLYNHCSPLCRGHSLLLFQSCKPSTVSYALRVKSKMLPIIYKPFMACPLPDLPLYFIQSLFSSYARLSSAPQRSTHAHPRGSAHCASSSRALLPSPLNLAILFPQAQS